MRFLVLWILASCGTDTVVSRSTNLNERMRPLAERSLAVIRVHHPEGVHAIRGSAPLSWETSTTFEGDTFTIAVDGELEFKPMLNEQWARGVNYRVRPGQTIDVYPHFKSDQGQVKLLFDGFYSNVLGNSRPVWAYLPPSYDENPGLRYPVVYMHDGQNVFDPASAFGGNEWRADETVDLGVKDGWLKEVIVIGIGNTSRRMSEYTPTNDGPKYIQFITDELMPEVRKALRVQEGPSNTAIIGSSLGGLISVYAGTVRPDVFGLIGALSPSTWYADRQIIGAVKAGLKPLKVSVDSGNAGPSNDDLDNTRDLAQAYRDIGFVDGTSLYYRVQDGASHNEYFWAQRLPDVLKFLFGA